MANENNTIARSSKHLAQFGEFSLDFETHELFRGAERIALPQQSARILELLVERHGELVTRDEIRRAIWGDRHVDFETSLNTAIRKIRRALGEAADTPAYVETVPKNGYRFLRTPEFDTGGDHAGMVRKNSGTLQLGVFGAAAMVMIVLAVWFIAARDTGVTSPADTAAYDSPGYESFLFGSHAMGQGDLAKAEQHFEESLRLDANYAPTYVGLAHAKVLNRQGQFSKVSEGQALLDKALAIAPDNADAQHLNGRLALYYWRDHKTAEASLDKALALSPGDPDVLTTLAYFHTISGDPDAALKAIGAAHALSPLSPNLNADYGWVHYKAGNWTDAERFCKTSVQLEPKSRFALDCVIHVNHSQGDHAEAAEFGMKVMELNGAPQSAIDSLRQIDDAGERERAYWSWRVEQLQRPVLSDRLPQRGIALTMLGRHDEAVAVFDEAFAKNGEPFLSFFAVDPRVSELRDHPEFAWLAELSRTPVVRELF